MKNNKPKIKVRAKTPSFASGGDSEFLAKLKDPNTKIGKALSKMDATQGIAAGMTTATELAADGNVDATDAGQIALDGIAGSTMGGKIGKQAAQIMTTALGDKATVDMGEGVDRQKIGVTAASKAMEYGGAGAEMFGPAGAAVGAVVGLGMGVLQGSKEKREAEKEFQKRRTERINQYNEDSMRQYANQYATYMKFGGKVYPLDYKKGGIYIKPENRGKFTAHCKREGFTKVTNECIEDALKSDSPSLRKQANFARNARKWRKMRVGGIVVVFQ